MIPNPVRTLHAVYDRQTSPEAFPVRTPVVAFDDEGRALVADPDSAQLVPAAEVAGFRFLEYYDQQLVFPAPSGWVVSELGDPSVELPVIAFVADSQDRIDPVFINQAGTVMWVPGDASQIPVLRAKLSAP